MKEDVSQAIYPFIRAYYKNYFPDYINWVLNDPRDLPLEFIGEWEDYHKFEPILDEKLAQYSES